MPVYLSANAIPQSAHLKGRSPVWVRMCVVTEEDWEKHFPHTEHAYGFSPVWVRTCVIKFADWVKAFGQCVHLYGFSPLCFLMWTINDDLREKSLLQILHRGFSRLVSRCSLELIVTFEFQIFLKENMHYVSYQCIVLLLLIHFLVIW